jgi:hypothetical protein
MIADISIYPQLDKWPVHRISMHSSCSYIIYMGREGESFSLVRTWKMRSKCFATHMKDEILKKGGKHPYTLWKQQEDKICCVWKWDRTEILKFSLHRNQLTSISIVTSVAEKQMAKLWSQHSWIHKELLK